MPDIPALARLEQALQPTTSNPQGPYALSTKPDATGGANTSVLATAVTVGLSALPLPATALANRRAIIIYNNGTVAIYVGDSGVTTSSGILVAAAQSIALNIGPLALIYGISGSGGQNVRVLEIS